MSEHGLHFFMCKFGYYCGDQRLLNTLEVLLAEGVDIDERDGKTGRTALQAACWEKTDGALIRFLLKHGASVGAVDFNGNTALHGAAYHSGGFKKWTLDRPEDDREAGHLNPWSALETIAALIAAGADPNAVNPQNGNTPMHWAAVHHGYAYLPFLEVLFERGGRVDLRNKNGLRPADFFYYDHDLKAEALRKKFRQALREKSKLR